VIQLHPRASDVPDPRIGHWACNGNLYIVVPETDAEKDQLEVLLEALRIYAERNEHYKDNWTRMGWRGMLVRVQERAERLWDSLWDHQTELTDSFLPARDGKLDDALDLINFAAFTIRGVRAGNRDGEWRWRSGPEERADLRARRLYNTFRRRAFTAAGRPLGTWEEISDDYKAAWRLVAEAS
jgi:hypothetical protein